MAHPMAHELQGRHERAREMIARTGNKAEKADRRQDEKLISTAMSEHDDQQHGGKKTRLKFKAGGAIEGHEARHHLGRRARGGSAGKRGTHVNVIVAPQGGGMRPAEAGAPPPPRPAMAPPAAPRPMPPPGAGPGGPPPGMMPPGGGMRPPGMMKRGGGIKKVVEAGVPSESLMQAKRGGRTAHRDMGGPMPGGQPGQSGQQQPTPQQIQQMMAARQAQGQPQQGQGPSPQQIQQMMAARQAQGGGQPGQPPMQKRGGAAKRREGGGVKMESGAGGGEGRIEKTHLYGEGGFRPHEHDGEFERDRHGRFTGGRV